jgi:hypothetical protein
VGAGVRDGEAGPAGRWPRPWARWLLPTPVGPTTSTLSYRSTKAQVASSSTLALGIEALKVKSKSSMVLACSMLARRISCMSCFASRRSTSSTFSVPPATLGASLDRGRLVALPPGTIIPAPPRQPGDQ